MENLPRTEIIKTHPIGKGLNAFRESFGSLCEELGHPSDLDALREIDSDGNEETQTVKIFLTLSDLQNLALDLVSALRALSTLRALPSVSGRKNLFYDILRLNSVISSDGFDLEHLIPLLTAVLNNESDEVIWTHVYCAVTEHTPPLWSLPFLGQTPFLHNTSSIVNSSEQRKHVDDVLKEELGTLFVGVPDLYKTFFGDIERLEEAAIAVFQRCKEGEAPIYSNDGWHDWPESATQNEVLGWLRS